MGRLSSGRGWGPSAGGGTGATSIMTGGVKNAVHQAVITAQVNPITAPDGVTFRIIGTTGVNVPAQLSPVGSTGGGSILIIPVDANGQAKVVLTSSDKDMEELTVQAEYPNARNKTIKVQQATGIAQFAFDPQEMVSDGESTMNINMQLWQAGTTTPVPGHAIGFSIVEVRNEDGDLVDVSSWGDYGTLQVSQDTTDPNGVATAVLQAGTEGGTIIIEAADSNDMMP